MGRGETEVLCIALVAACSFPRIVAASPAAPVVAETTREASTTAPESSRYLGLTHGFSVGTEGSFHSIQPVGLVVGGVGPRRRFGLDLRVSVGFSVVGMGSVARPADPGSVPSEMSTVPLTVHTAATMRLGGTRGRTWVHPIVPISIDFHPGRYGSDIRYAAYFNAGAGMGVLRAYGDHGLFGFDAAVVGGINAGETFGNDVALYPRWRGGIEAAVWLGFRL